MPVSACAAVGSWSLLRRLCFEAEFGERLFQQLGCQLYFTRALFARASFCAAPVARAVPGIVRGITLRFMQRE